MTFRKRFSLTANKTAREGREHLRSRKECSYFTLVFEAVMLQLDTRNFDGAFCCHCRLLI